MKKVIEAKWFHSKNADVFVCASKVLGSVHAKDGYWVATTTNYGENRVVKVVLREDGLRLVEREFGVIEIKQ